MATKKPKMKAVASFDDINLNDAKIEGNVAVIPVATKPIETKNETKNEKKEEVTMSEATTKKEETTKTTTTATPANPVTPPPAPVAPDFSELQEVVNKLKDGKVTVDVQHHEPSAGSEFLRGLAWGGGIALGVTLVTVATSLLFGESEE